MNREKLYTFLINNDIKIEEDLYNYGIYVLTTYLKYLIFLFPIALLMGTFIETTIFVLLFIPLRRYIGGFHMNNMKSCFYASVLIGIIIPYCSSHLFVFSMIHTLLIFVSCFWMTKKFGVIDHPKKVISNKEKIIYLEKSLKIEVIYFAISIISNLMSYYFINNLVCYIYIFFILGMIIKKIENIKYK